MEAKQFNLQSIFKSVTYNQCLSKMRQQVTNFIRWLYRVQVFIFIFYVLLNIIRMKHVF